MNGWMANGATHVPGLMSLAPVLAVVALFYIFFFMLTGFLLGGTSPDDRICPGALGRLRRVFYGWSFASVGCAVLAFLWRTSLSPEGHWAAETKPAGASAVISVVPSGLRLGGARRPGAEAPV
jgi:hypothetical protein